MADVAAPRPSHLGLFDPLRDHDFRLLWTGYTTSALADQVTIVALAWLALQTTGSPLSVGGVLTAAAVPRALFTLVGGALSDRVGARRLGIVTSLSRVAVMTTLATLVLTHALVLGELYAMALLFGIVDAFFAPTRVALISQCVPADRLEAANSLTGTTSSMTTLAGPAAGGLLVASAGSGWALATDALLFTVVAATAFGVRGAARSRPAAGTAQSIWRDVASGLAYAFRDPVLRTLVIIATAAAFAVSGPVEVGLAALARNRFGGAAALGVLLGSFGAGMLIGTLLAGALPSKRLGPRLGATALVFAALMPLVGVSPALVVGVVLIVVMGVAAGQVNVIAASWLMRRTDPAYIGRVMSLMILTSVGISPISLAMAGAIAQVSVPLVFTISGGVMLLAGVTALASRTMRDA